MNPATGQVHNHAIEGDFETAKAKQTMKRKDRESSAKPELIIIGKKKSGWCYDVTFGEKIFYEKVNIFAYNNNSKLFYAVILCTILKGSH